MNTVNCKEVWEQIKKLKDAGANTKALEDAFCDFECAWEEHAFEYHMNEVGVETLKGQQHDTIDRERLRDWCIPHFIRVELYRCTTIGSWSEYQIDVAVWRGYGFTLGAWRSEY